MSSEEIGGQAKEDLSVDLGEIPLGKLQNPVSSHLDTGARLATPKQKKTLNTWKDLFVKEKNTNSLAKNKVLSKMKQLLKVAKKMAKKDKEVPRITRRRKKKANRAAYKNKYQAGTVKK
jgi:hypothetical protein